LFCSNVVHGSDSEKAAKREVDLWFKPEELINYHRAGAQHLHDKYAKE
jgi:nucleoside-diphosphate kinase